MYKLVSDLNSTIWYRLLKVAYVCLFAFITLFVISGSLVAPGEMEMSSSFDLLLSIAIFIVSEAFLFLLFRIIQHVFYYIFLGTFKPQK